MNYRKNLLPTAFPSFLFALFLAVFLAGLFFVPSVKAQTKNFPYFLRFKVTKPAAPQNAKVTISGFRHAGDPWYFPRIEQDAQAGQWSDWIDLSEWKWHGKIFRSGGIAEYPSISLSVAGAAAGSEFEVQLADAPGEKGIVASFKEQSASDTIIFLAPYPLRENFRELETARQMIERQAKWANEATGGKSIRLRKFDVITNIWGVNDPLLKEKSVALLDSLGFNVLYNVELPLLEKYDLKSYQKTWLYKPDPENVSAGWEQTVKTGALVDKSAFWEIADEVSILRFNEVEKRKVDEWFAAYLKDKNLNLSEAPAEYPLEVMAGETLPQNASINDRKKIYHAVKFGQWWSARQLRQISGLILKAQPAATTSTLLPSHGFMGNAWGPSNIGMSYGMLDIFELAEQNSVNQIAVEDWMGLNHMYGPEYTWTGGQTFAYYNALVRSAIGEKPIKMQALITPSDDKYLRLKAFSGLGQGAKSFYFWSYGPTFVSTENYWSDLESQYHGIAKLNRSLEKSEDVLFDAKPVSDESVGILYSVSHDIWNNKNQAAFVEKRLLWHALRHLHVQPNFLREEDIETGKLSKLKILYVTDWNISRRASAEIDKWVKSGGVLYMSAGAATRDEFNDAYLPPFAKTIWTANPAQKIIIEKGTFNERTVLPKIKPLTTARVDLSGAGFDLPVIGVRLDLAPAANPTAKFADGKNAALIVPYGRGQIVALGFLPMLAYGKAANFKPETLEEKWQPEARRIIEKTLELAKIDPVIKASQPVVETSLLKGTDGAALVLANYTYAPIRSFVIDVKISKPYKMAASVSGAKVKILKQSAGKITLELPVDWTDVIILK